MKKLVLGLAILGLLALGTTAFAYGPGGWGGFMGMSGGYGMMGGMGPGMVGGYGNGYGNMGQGMSGTTLWKTFQRWSGYHGQNGNNPADYDREVVPGSTNTRYGNMYRGTGSRFGCN